MKLTKCDQCGIQAEAEKLYGNPPKDWYFFRRSDYVQPEQHLCSLDCVISRAAALAMEQKEKEQVHG